MKLLNKIYSLIKRMCYSAKLSYLKHNMKEKFHVGSNLILSKTSRLNVFDEKGRLIIGNSFSIGNNSELYVWDGKIEIGDNTSINDNCKLYGNISIGSNCLLASNIFISSGSHSFKSHPALPIKMQDKSIKIDGKIIIEDDCWIGWGVVIMPGVYIGKGAIIGANAVVTKDVFPYSVIGGIPGKQISERLNFKKSFTTLKSEDSKYLPFFYRGLDYSQFEGEYSIKNGILMEGISAIFLLSKSEGYKVKLEGEFTEASFLEIYLNNQRFAKTESLVNLFKLEIDLELIKNEVPVDYNELSDQLKKMFDIITIKIQPGPKGLKSGKYSWKINSLGLYEN